MKMSANGKPFPRSFFLRSTVEVARGLLGALLVRELRRGGRIVRLVGRIVEVEAYLQGDPACHSVRELKDGTCVPRPSERNRSMFGPPGRAYVYFTYGMHWAVNVVAQKEGLAEGVLIRALEPVEGAEIMAELRAEKRGPRPISTVLKSVSVTGSLQRCTETRTDTSNNNDAGVSPRFLRQLASGPGKLTQALAIDRSLDGHDLSKPPLTLLQGQRVPPDRVGVSRRIGIRKAVERQLRFFEIGNPFVSKEGRRS